MANSLIKLLISFAIFTFVTSAQIVETITLSTSVDGDGIVIGPGGDIYLAGGWNRSNVFRINMNGDVTTYASGLSGPTAVIFIPDTDTLLVSNWSSGIINFVLPSGESGVYANLSFGPGGMVFDDERNLYVAHNKDNQGVGGISKVTPSGVVSNFASGGTINDPVGLAIDEDGFIYAGNLKDSRITRIDPDGNQTLIATINISGQYKVGHIEYLNGDIYATAVSGHRVYKATLSGDVSVFAGDGIYGVLDGPVLDARFTYPNGICRSVTGDTLFIRETLEASNRLRIIYDLATDVEEKTYINPQQFQLYQNYPNPFNPSTTIEYEIAVQQFVNIKVYDSLGRKIATLINEEKSAGHHTITFDATYVKGRLSSGIYIYQLKSGENIFSRKMISMK